MKGPCVVIVVNMLPEILYFVAYTTSITYNTSGKVYDMYQSHVKLLTCVLGFYIYMIRCAITLHTPNDMSGIVQRIWHISGYMPDCWQDVPRSCTVYLCEKNYTSPDVVYHQQAFRVNTYSLPVDVYHLFWSVLILCWCVFTGKVWMYRHPRVGDINLTLHVQYVVYHMYMYIFIF